MCRRYRVEMKAPTDGIRHTIGGVRAEEAESDRAQEIATAVIGQRQRADFSELTGKWVDDPAFDEVIAVQRQVDPDKWN